LMLAFVLVVLGWRLFGGAGGDLVALRAQMATNAGVKSAIALQGQDSFIEAETVLLPILEKNPGEPTARALYNTIHDEADNQRALQEALSLIEQKNIDGALVKLSEIEDSSAFAINAKVRSDELQKSSLVSSMRGAAGACEAGSYSDCLDRICAYITTTEETDSDIVNLARVAYGQKLRSSAPSNSCVSDADAIEPTQADKSRATVEKLYATDPRKDYVLAYFNGQSAQDTATQLQEAAAGADKPAQKKLFEEAAAAFLSITRSLESFSESIKSGNLDEAASFANSILKNEQRLFKDIESPISADVRKQLLSAYAKEFATRTFSNTSEFQEGKDFIKRMAAFDTNNNSPLRFAMAVRYQAALRDAFERSLNTPDSKKILEVLLPFLNKGKLKATIQAKLSELTPK
jgi:hypothetical protein